MLEDDFIIKIITEKVAHSSKELDVTSWLLPELKELIANYQDLINSLFRCNVEYTSEILDDFFDSIRPWDGHIAKSIAEEIKCYDKTTWKNLSLQILVKSGLCIELAIHALEITKYKAQQTPVIHIELLEPIFFLNQQLRMIKKDQEVDRSGGADATSTSFNSNSKLKPFNKKKYL
jgi:hypothetical protein